MMEVKQLTEKVQELIEISKQIDERSKQSIVFSKPIIERKGIGVIFPHTINVIQGRKGVHKSRITELICSCILSNNLSIDYLGFKANPMISYSVIHIDTERNINDQYPYSIQQLRLKAGFQKDDHLINFHFTSLIRIPRELRLVVLGGYLNHFRKDNSNHIIIIIDVITDCIKNFNDPKESMEMIDLLNEMINEYKVTFICVIHENPSSSEKARGHLGTEIINKASQVIHIGFEAKDLIELKFLHSRNTRRLDTIYLRYSDEAKGLVEADSEYVKAKLQDTKKVTNELIIEQLRNMFTNEEILYSNQLASELSKLFNCGEKVIRNRLEEIVNEQTSIINKIGEDCKLIATAKIGCPTNYSLVVK